MSALEQALAALFFCGLLAILVWLLRRGRLASIGWSGRQSQTGGRMEVVARRALTPQHMLHLVNADGAAFLVATHPHGMEIASLPCSRMLADPGSNLEEEGRH